MKNNILFLLIVLMMSGISDKMNAREVTSFNDGWEFKKGPSRKKLCRPCRNGIRIGKK